MKHANHFLNIPKNIIISGAAQFEIYKNAEELIIFLTKKLHKIMIK